MTCSQSVYIGAVRRWKTGARPSHDFWVAPGGFDLESSTAFVEPSTPLEALVVIEFEPFVAPDERGTSLRARIGSGESKGHINKNHTGVGKFRSFQCRSHQALMTMNVIGTAAAT